MKNLIILFFGFLISGCGTSTSGTGVSLNLVQSPQTLIAGTCIGPYTFELDNSQGATTAAGSTQFILTENSTHLTFFSDQNCQSSITQPVLAAGQSQFSFYVTDTVAENLSLSLNSGSLSLSFVTQINPGPSTLVELAGPTVGVLGECVGPYTLDSKDSYGNFTSENGTISFTISASTDYISYLAYADSGCTTSITQDQTSTSGVVDFYVEVVSTAGASATIKFSTESGISDTTQLDLSFL